MTPSRSCKESQREEILLSKSLKSMSSGEMPHKAMLCIFAVVAMLSLKSCPKAVWLWRRREKGTKVVLISSNC